MEQFYAFCAIVGGIVFVGQFLFSLIGLGAAHDMDGDGGHFGGDHFGGDHADAAGHEVDGHGPGGDGHHGEAPGHESATWRFLGVLSLRTVIAGVTFFGLAGLAANASGVSPFGALVIAGAAGISALYLVAWIMRGLMKLRSDGTARIQNAVGQTATVYLTIPGHRAGKGKITVTVQNRTMEYEAETDSDTLPTAAPVQVVGVVDAETVAVVPAPEPARSSHA